MRVREFRTFGATMLTLVGGLNVAQGLLVAYASGGVGFDRAAVAYTSAGTWAAATVTLGALLAAAGLALHGRRPWAKRLAVGVVALHAVSQLAMLRAYPAWSLMMVTLDVIILFLLTVPRGSVVEAPSPGAAETPAPVEKLALRRNGRADAYRPRHKRGRPVPPAPSTAEAPLEPAVESDAPVTVTASVGEPVPAAEALLDETVEAELVLEPPTTWVRAVGQATVPDLELRVPVQRSSLESLDPLIDPLPIVLAGEAAIAASEVLDAEEAPMEELAAIGARPYVNH